MQVLDPQHSPEKIDRVLGSIPFPLSKLIVWVVFLSNWLIPFSKYILDGPPQVVKEHEYQYKIMKVFVCERVPLVVDEYQ